MKNIEKMSNWDILTYLRINRNWMVQSHYSREDIDCEFTDEEWVDFTSFDSDGFDCVKKKSLIQSLNCGSEEMKMIMSNQLSGGMMSISFLLIIILFYIEIMMRCLKEIHVLSTTAFKLKIKNK